VKLQVGIRKIEAYEKNFKRTIKFMVFIKQRSEYMQIFTSVKLRFAIVHGRVT
jgi:hypothetical protein